MALEEGFLLADWTVEPALQQVRRGGRTLSIEPQAMQVLVCLAHRAGTTVSTDEIVQEVWHGRPTADNPVYKAIAKLRQALGDEPRNPRFIQTVTKRGYRLIAPVAELPEPSTQPEPTQAIAASDNPLPTPSGRRVWQVVALGFLLACVVIGVNQFMGRESKDRGAPILKRLVGLPGSNSDPSSSADGRQFVFLNDRGRGAQLWIADVATNALTQLTHNAESTSAPAWSPTDDHILFHRAGSVWLTRATADVQPLVLIENATHASWSPDGSRIVFERGSEVWTARADGLGQRRIEGIPSRAQFFEPRAPIFTPDGQHVVYFEARQGPMGSFFVCNLADQTLRQLTFVDSLSGKPALSEDGAWVLFHSAHNGSQSLWRVSLAGGVPELLIASTSDDTNPVSLKNNGGVVYESSREQWSLVLTDVATDKSDILAQARHPIVAPELSPDGKSVAYFRPTVAGGVHIFYQDLSGGVPVQLTSGDSVNVMPKWSADGQWLYHYHSGESFSWRRIAVAGAAIEAIAGGWNFNREHDAAINPEGTLAIYAVLDSDHVVESRIRNLVSGLELPFAQKISWVDWSNDGARVVAADFSKTKVPVGPIVVCTLGVANEHSCEQLAERGQHPVWSVNNESVFFVDPLDATRLAVWRYDIAEQALTQVTELSPMGVGLAPFIDVTHDQKILWVRHRPAQSELWHATWPR